MRRHVVLFVLAATLLTAAGGRLVYIEHTAGAALRQRAERQHTATLTIPARRGDIFDTKGRVLAGTVYRSSIYVDVAQVQDLRFAAYSIAPVLLLDPVGLEDLLRQKRESRFVWVKRGVSDRELEAFRAVRDMRRLHAFVVCQEPRRSYPCGRLAAQVLGFVGAEQFGLAGVEQVFDEMLRGADGRRVATVDSRRRRVRAVDGEYEAPRDGACVVLTIDAHIQERAEHHLRAAVARFKAEWGTAVVLDPQSGEVLAMATIPDFDPAQPIPPGLGPNAEKAALEGLRNRAIADAFEPGSIFKPFVAALALNEKVTRLDEVFSIGGPARSFGRRIIHDTHAYGSLTLHEVISKSSNIGMALLGVRSGPERVNRWVRAFGFGSRTGIELPGENAGLVPAPASWTGYTVQSVPFGQEVAVTPIQIATAFSALANDGVLYRPRIVRGVIDADGEVLMDNSRPVSVRRILEPDVARAFREKALVEVVTEGTGKRAAILDYQVFGKTGTAQAIAEGRKGYVPNKYIGSFVGGAPSDEPRVVVVVSIYWPRGGEYYGGTVAAPTAGAIIADALAYLRVPPQARGAETRNHSGNKAQKAE